MIGAPPSGDRYLMRVADVLRAIAARREAIIVGSRVDGTSWHLRFLASLSTPYVQVHVQSTAAGEGGVAGYDPANFTSSTEVDCRQERLQDVEVPNLVGGEDYIVFLAPKQVSGDGSKVLYDGQSGSPDSLTFAMVSA